MIYICIPAHNEERTIGVVLWKIRQVMANFPRDYQILVANDGSSDKTADVLEPYQRVLPLSVLYLQKRRGYACALELLLREAVRRAEYPKRDVIVTLQADFTEDPEHLTALLKRIEAGADVVCTNSTLPEKAARTQRWSRSIGRALLRRRRWPEEVTDPLSGFRAYRVHTVRKAFEQVGSNHLLTWDGPAANVELLTAVLPHARRTDALEAKVRSDRQQRPTRQTFWGVVGAVLRLATGGVGPMKGRTLELASWQSADVRRNREDARRVHVARSTEDRPTSERERRRRRPESARKSRPEGRGSRAEGRAPRPEVREPRPEGEPQKRRPRSRRNGNGQAPAAATGEAHVLEIVAPETLADGVPPKKKRRRRRRRAGSNKTVKLNGAAAVEAQEAPESEAGEGEGVAPAADVVEGAEVTGPSPKRRRSRRGGRGRRGRRGGGNTATSNGVSEEGSEPSVGSADAPPRQPPEPFLGTGTD